MAALQWQAFGVVDGYASTVFAVRDTEASAVEDARAALGTHIAAEVHRRTQGPDNHIDLERIHTFTAEPQNRGDAA
ncbi:Uncharacterised protein (plasmid) [Tsukamurella tyrosinosolvens]|uniref:Uncharacterized protein n=1 Tax=Tsukamurella tyrosinosolvens TaxID=57704 RepID=A0A1H4V4R6_TSUTY|nr:hypothetical protein [Tsukamurella tyrosinosolvens]KXO91052.1 hypothetical protein AXK58_21720 [Tsukamurella tyrosinosolvens]SEC75840.1 hypothetical protein SAMN04489793_3137 [Tsukamurella tyrosinosolvens]VEH90690.1 Uncharacterised protein [Tsukamurella tyrosinosolvens]